MEWIPFHAANNENANISHLAWRSALTRLVITILFLTVFSKVFMSESSIILSFLYQNTLGRGSPGQHSDLSSIAPRKCGARVWRNLLKVLFLNAKNYSFNSDIIGSQ